MKKELSQLLNDLQDFQVYGAEEAAVTGISDDSRRVKEGDLFVAIKGETFDAHKFIPAVIRKSVSVVVGERKPNKNWLKNTTYVKVPSSRLALALIAYAWYGYPSKKLKLIGVTGTDGKTTTSNLIYWILSKSGKKTGLISTISAKIGEKEYDTGFHVTNPEPLSLQKFLAKMVDARCKYAVLEVTSHGLDQERVAGVDFDIAVLTNITHEHLDYHKTWKDYRRAKARLFKRTKSLAIINKDDKSYGNISALVPKRSKIISYGIKSSADYQAETITLDNIKMDFKVRTSGRIYPIKTSLLGEYNVENILAAVACTRSLGITWRSIQKSLRDFPCPTGRLEEIASNKGYRVYVDFAHTPNSLKLVLILLRKLTEGKLIAVLGSAGERDIEKRTLMGEISARLADISVFTAEDPRSEDVNDIISKMVISAKQTGAKEARKDRFETVIRNKGRWLIRVPERGEAIALAIQKLANRGDTVVICGKGHEKSMAYNGIEYPWSDHQAARVALRGGVKKIIRK